MAFLSEAAVELALLEQLRGLGYACTSDEAIGSDSKRPERDSYNKMFKNHLIPLGGNL